MRICVEHARVGVGCLSKNSVKKSVWHRRHQDGLHAPCTRLDQRRHLRCIHTRACACMCVRVYTEMDSKMEAHGERDRWRETKQERRGERERSRQSRAVEVTLALRWFLSARAVTLANHDGAASGAASKLRDLCAFSCLSIYIYISLPSVKTARPVCVCARARAWEREDLCVVGGGGGGNACACVRV